MTTGFRYKQPTFGVQPPFPPGGSYSPATVSPVIADSSAPTTDGTYLYWIDNSSNPHKAYSLLNNGSGTAQWVLTQPGNP